MGFIQEGGTLEVSNFYTHETWEITPEDVLGQWIHEHYKEREGFMTTYPLSTDQAARSNLDVAARNSGYEDAGSDYPFAVLSKQDLEVKANQLVDTALENEGLTNDPEEYRARFVYSYCKAYREEVKSRDTDEEEG